MERLIPVLKDAVVAALITQASRPKHRADMAGMGLMVLSGLIAFLALIYAAFALYTVLDVHVSAQAAFAVVAAGLVLLSLLTGWGGLRLMRRQERDISIRARQEIRSLVDTVADEILPSVAQPVRDSPKTALAAAAIAGFLAGEKIH